MSWHPIEYGFKTGPEELTLIDPHYGYFAVIRRLQFGTDTYYRAVTWADESHSRKLIGYAKDVRTIAFKAYRYHLTHRDLMPKPFTYKLSRGVEGF